MTTCHHSPSWTWWNPTHASHYHQIRTSQDLFSTPLLLLAPSMSPQSHIWPSPTVVKELDLCPPAFLPHGSSWKSSQLWRSFVAPASGAVSGHLLNSNDRNISVLKDWGKNGLQIWHLSLTLNSQLLNMETDLPLRESTIEQSFRWSTQVYGTWNNLPEYKRWPGVPVQLPGGCSWSKTFKFPHSTGMMLT